MAPAIAEPFELTFALYALGDTRRSIVLLATR